MAAETNGHTLSGEVEVDGAYFGGHVRPANKAEDRVDRRLTENQTGKRRVVVAIRQRKGRTLSFVVRQEADGVALVRAKVAADAKVHADEASHRDGLHAFFEAHRINHTEAYSLNGVCTNQAESYFSRLRRMVQASITTSAPATCSRIDTYTRSKCGSSPRCWRIELRARITPWLMDMQLKEVRGMSRRLFIHSQGLDGG
jgi:hypothetical protein